MDKDILSNKILLAKKCGAGSVYIIEMSEAMLAVVAVDGSNDIICSRSFFFSKKTKSKASAEARRYFKQLRECIMEGKLGQLDELDLL